ncbi:MAG TPA: DinB family protein [Ktedonobacterales bacterium]|nr:DinB family protein [Ktedonobacterales bacterium]
MGKADFLERMQLARAALNEAISGLTDDQMSQDLVTGEWTVKDILAHLAAWQGEVIVTIERITHGDRNDALINESVDEWNARRVNERRRLPLMDVMQEFHDAHDRLLALLGASPAEHIPLGPDGWDETAKLWWLTEHDGEHTEAIRAYRRRLAQGA